ncbi:MAG: hypothetical protein QOE41_1803 [Mycobacterium sp.]|nr:hypothetical protein [Mycobacterium sp.]MDT5132492.1 hypothetical protein [Mycobacterium sp.]
MTGTAKDIDVERGGNEQATPNRGGGHPRARRWTTWLLALLTVPVAVVVVIFDLGAVMSTSGCTSDSCQGPSGWVFGILLYGAPVVAALAILISFFTARRPWGIVVPLCGLALLVADIAVTDFSFRT